MNTVIRSSAMNEAPRETIAMVMALADGRPGKVAPGVRPTAHEEQHSRNYLHLRNTPCAAKQPERSLCDPKQFHRTLRTHIALACPACTVTYLKRHGDPSIRLEHQQEPSANTTSNAGR